MKVDEPERAWQNEQHQRILRRDVTAFAQLCESALPHLVAFLEGHFVFVENHLHQTVAIDCLLDYRFRPTQYNPGKLSLFAYLRMAAKNDMLNLLDKEGRRERRTTDIHTYDVQQQLVMDKTPSKELARNDWLQQYTDKTPSDVLRALAGDLDFKDQQVLLLMFEGVRSTTRYAELLDITHLSAPDQKREVKRTKDRLAKKIQRFGDRLRQNQVK